MNKNKTRISEEIEKGVKYLNTGLIMVLVLCSTLFLMTVSSSSQNGYKFRQEEIINKQLTVENHELQLKVLEATSFNVLQETGAIDHMVEADDINYFETRYERTKSKRLSYLKIEISQKIYLIFKTHLVKSLGLNALWSHRLVVRTPGFHPGNRSSILLGTTIFGMLE